MSDASPTTVAPGRRFRRLPSPNERVSGLSRGALYQLAKKHRGLFLKYGAATLLDLELLDKILAELPPANIGAAGCSWATQSQTES
jgi:hypothetical protein